MNTEPIVIEQPFQVPASRIWSALTLKQEMKLWYFDLVEFIPRPGFKFQFSGGPAPDRQYLHLCEVEEVVPNKKLSYSWRYEGYSGASEVTFELADFEDKTMLRLIHAGIETFPAENPDLSKINFQLGWESIIKVSLRRYLEI